MRAKAYWSWCLSAVLLGVCAQEASAQRQRVVTELAPVVGGYIGSEGEAELDVGRRETEFEVEIEDVPDGVYGLAINGVLRATIEVERGDGEVEFSSRPGRRELLLDFDPDGALVEIVEGDRVILAGLARDAGVATTRAEFPRQSVRTDLTAIDDAQQDRARVRLRFRSTSRRAELRIDARRLVDDEYTLLVDGQEVARVESRRGRIRERFVTEPRAGQRALTFDPARSLIELVRNERVAFGARLEGTPLGNGVSVLGELERPMMSTGAEPGAEGEVELRVRPDDTELEIEVEDVPVGIYSVIVDGLTVGMFEVVLTEDGREGAIEFSTDADQDDELPLTFDPLGRTIEVADLDGVVVLDVVFDGLLTPGDGLDDDDVDEDEEEDDDGDTD